MANSPTLTSFSSGVVEISAVATLIGAPIVEAMTLGLKSAACLPWASISSFGLLHVAKASLAAAVPDWSRESLGLQNENPTRLWVFVWNWKCARMGSSRSRGRGR